LADTPGRETRNEQFILVTAAAAIILAIPALWSVRISSTTPATVPTIAPFQVKGWQLETQMLMPPWKPAFENPSLETRFQFTKGDMRVGVYIEYYRRQGFERKLVSSQNVFVHSLDPAWNQVMEGTRKVDLPEGVIRAKWAELKAIDPASTTRLEILEWYWVGGHVTSSNALAKWLIAKAKLIGNADDSAAVIVYAVKKPDHGGMSAMNNFIGDGWPAIEAALHATSVRGGP
jgi:EpsI family protein